MMKENTQEIYQYNEDLHFIVRRPMFGDWSDDLDQREVIFVCPRHRVLLVPTKGDSVFYTELSCLACEREGRHTALVFSDQEYKDLQEKALSLLDSRDLQHAKLVRLDDAYTPEITKFNALNDKKTDYFIKADVKTDVDGDTIVVLYVGSKNEKSKSQFFIKPEKLQLSHDFKDQDPARILAKIKLTLKDRVIEQKYDNPDSKSKSEPKRSSGSRADEQY